MLKCWEENPSDRPTFTKLKDKMKEIERNHRVSMGYNGDDWVFIFISFNYHEWEVTLYRTFFILGHFFLFWGGGVGGDNNIWMERILVHVMIGDCINCFSFADVRQSQTVRQQFVRQRWRSYSWITILSSHFVVRVLTSMQITIVTSWLLPFNPPLLRVIPPLPWYKKCRLQELLLPRQLENGGSC